jgi:hypothetical protein
MYEFEVCGRTQQKFILKYYPTICMEVLGKTPYKSEANI